MQYTGVCKKELCNTALIAQPLLVKTLTGAIAYGLKSEPCEIRIISDQVLNT